MIENALSTSVLVLAQGIVLYAIKRNYEESKEAKEMAETNSDKLDVLAKSFSIEEVKE